MWYSRHHFRVPTKYVLTACFYLSSCMHSQIGSMLTGLNRVLTSSHAFFPQTSTFRARLVQFASSTKAILQKQVIIELHLSPWNAWTLSNLQGVCLLDTTMFHLRPTLSWNYSYSCKDGLYLKSNGLRIIFTMAMRRKSYARSSLYAVCSLPVPADLTASPDLCCCQ